MDNKANYQASGTIACTLASLGTSSGLVAGRSTAEVDNSSDLYLDRVISGKIQVGTSPAAATVIEVWLIPKLADGAYFDNQGGSGFDGTDKAVTVTSRGILQSYGTLLASLTVDATTSNRDYFIPKSSVRTGLLPAQKFQLFIVHNTGVALNATGGNHLIYEKPEHVTTA